MSRVSRPEAVYRLLLNVAGVSAAVLLGLAVMVAACGGDEPQRGAAAAGAPAQKAPAKAGKAGGAAEAQAKADTPAEEPIEPGAPLKGRELPDDAFIETDENRDPFRPYLAVVGKASGVSIEAEPRPDVLLDQHQLDSLRLIAIVSGAEGNPRAMLVDPDGKGWIVRRGDYVGRGERISLGPGQPDREINWRVVRVRPDRLIFVREDPSGLGNPITRVMRLYPEEDAS